jgi:hypothetical protein
METTIKIQNLNSDYLEELAKDSLLDEIFGGDGSSTGGPNADTSFAYDAAYVATAAVKIYLRLNPTTAWMFL